MQRRCVRAIANAVELSTPIEMRPAERAASAAPMPPGTGITLDSTDAEVLMKISWARLRLTP